MNKTAQEIVSEAQEIFLQLGKLTYTQGQLHSQSQALLAKLAELELGHQAALAAEKPVAASAEATPGTPSDPSSETAPQPAQSVSDATGVA
jgi:hypothetical protein